MSSTTLIDACASGQTEAVERLLSAPDIDVNQTDNNGRTPLYIASENGHVSVVEQLLIAPSIDVNQKNRYGWTPLIEASHNGHLTIVERLEEWNQQRKTEEKTIKASEEYQKLQRKIQRKKRRLDELMAEHDKLLEHARKKQTTNAFKNR